MVVTTTVKPRSVPKGQPAPSERRTATVGGEPEDETEAVALGLGMRFPDSSPYLSRGQVLALVPVSYAALWGWMRDGKFPAAREIGPGGRRCKIGWLKSEVHDWIANRPVRTQRQKPRVAA